MKTLFAALASALLVSTAFAQTAAPSSTQPAQMPAAGQANLKASAAVQTGSTNESAATAKAPAKAVTKTPMKKTSATHTVKAHKTVKKHAVETSNAKAKTGSAKEASNAPAKADGAQADTTRTQ